MARRLRRRAIGAGAALRPDLALAGCVGGPDGPRAAALPRRRGPARPDLAPNVAPPADAAGR